MIFSLRASSGLRFCRISVALAASSELNCFLSFSISRSSCGTLPVKLLHIRWWHSWHCLCINCSDFCNVWTETLDWMLDEKQTWGMKHVWFLSWTTKSWFLNGAAVSQAESLVLAALTDVMVKKSWWTTFLKSCDLHTEQRAVTIQITIFSSVKYYIVWYVLLSLLLIASNSSV